VADTPYKPRPGEAREPEPDSKRRRSLSLTDRPATTSSASLLSLANAFADGDGLRPLPAPPAGLAGSRPLDGPAASERAPLAPDGPRVREERGAEMRARLALGDFTGALDLAEQITSARADDPLDHEARRCAEGCRATLIRMYHARIGPLDRVPVVIVPPDQLRWLSLDHRAGFVLSHVDGASTLEEILDVSGMPALHALRILAELVTKRVIAFH